MGKRCLTIAVSSCGSLLLWMSLGAGSTAAATDWPSFGHDPQRSNSAEEKILSPSNVSGLKLEWSTQVDNVPLSLNSLTAPVVADNIVTAQGKKSVVYVAGSSNTFFALDAQNGALLWNRTLESAVSPLSESFFLCPNAANATPVLDAGKMLVYTLSGDGKLYGLDLGSGAIKFGPFQFVPAYAKAWSLNLYHGVVYTSTSQGCAADRSGIYSMDVSDGMHPVSHQLLTGHKLGAGMWSRGGVVIDKDERVYASMGDGNVDPATGDLGSSFLAATLADLKLADYYTPSNWQDINKHDLDIPSGGLAAFSFNHQSYLAGGGKESVVYLLADRSLGGKDHHTPIYSTPVLANDAKELEQKGMWGAPAVWTETKDGTTWLYVTIWGPLSKQAPSFPMTNGDAPNGCIVAFQVVLDPKTRQPTLQPAWVSPDLNLPDPPIVANGVLYALATGENSQQVHVEGLMHFASVEDWKKNLLTNEQRGLNTRPAVLYAMDAKTGKLLYQSGDAMKSWTHFSGLAINAGHVYAVDHSSRVYSFGFGVNP